MLGIECVHPGGIEPNPNAANAFIEGCKSRGLLVGKGGLYGNVIRLTPMLNVSEEEVNEGCAVIAETIQSISG